MLTTIAIKGWFRTVHHVARAEEDVPACGKTGASVRGWATRDRACPKCLAAVEASPGD